ncbi:hypothetical protein AB0I81_50785 [Nonomuraea sp. NPDC050404]|uniref:hypothetical protein n=1 Tax=Nonomuraea sp. NPDC050404 TaxID=3155783 RepID=UPI0033C83E53
MIGADAWERAFIRQAQVRLLLAREQAISAMAWAERARTRADQAQAGARLRYQEMAARRAFAETATRRRRQDLAGKGDAVLMGSD